MASAFQEWLQQGEQLYNTSLREYHEIERQIAELESRLAEKQHEVNQVAQIIGKPAVDGSRRLSAQLVSAEIVDAPPGHGHPALPGVVGVPSHPAPTGSNANIARALTGKFGR